MHGAAPPRPDDQSRPGMDGSSTPKKRCSSSWLRSRRLARAGEALTPMPTSAEGPPLDIKRILTALDRHHVEYLAVGGIAANAYGARRRTEDFDCVPNLSFENLSRLASAMRAQRSPPGRWTYRRRGSPAPHRPRRTSSRSDGAVHLEHRRRRFDVLADLPNRDGEHLHYEELSERAVTLQLPGGTTVRVAALDDVIASKDWANRPTDHEALPELHAIRARQSQPDTHPPRSDLSAKAYPRSPSAPRPPGPPPGTAPSTRATEQPDPRRSR